MGNGIMNGTMYVVDEEKCSGCAACVDVCPLEAIAVVEGLAVIDYAKCTVCGLCEYDCPSEAIYEANREGSLPRGQ
ncbi:MAG: indolepyruvate ferredoxin oxidoreductase subunit alpha [Chloroflexota bacterium]